ncbi:MAG: peptidylprolyl isomerase [Proteobacteria bacterium]|nr:peptidylprolyl isomerase [Pseudomonadota bacterium]MBU4289304.1 peptidylprolyl isomerase [Pseudomonadota bacterium]MCG2759433.1 peptidylprolyl isomerase [Desulfobacteraceae bacterium]
MPMKIYTGNLLGERFIYAIIVALSLSLSALTVQAEKNEPSIDKVAIVNGSVITGEEFNRELSQVKQRISQQGLEISSPQLEGIRNEILDNLINLELLFQESQNNGIKVEKEAIDSQMKSLKQKFPNDTEFENFLSKLNLSESTLKLKIEKGIAIQELIETQVTNKIKLLDEESKSCYDTYPDLFKQSEQVKASHILIRVKPEADEAQKSEAKEKIKTIQLKLKNGEDFAALAKEFSEGPSKNNGGDLGYFQRGQMVKSFEDIAFALKTEEVSDIVETQFGYHIIKVVDKTPEKTIGYENVKEDLAQHLKQEKTKQEVNKYIQKLREKSKIEKFL